MMMTNHRSNSKIVRERKLTENDMTTGKVIKMINLTIFCSDCGFNIYLFYEKIILAHYYKNRYGCCKRDH